MKQILLSISVFILGMISLLNAQTVSFTSDFTNGCAPLTVNFTNTSSFGQTANYHWDFGNGQGFDGFNSSFTFTNTGNFRVLLTAVNLSGQYIGEYSMQIYVNGTSQSFYISTGTQVCPGQIINFSSFDQTNSIKWFFADGDSALWSNVSHTYQNPGVYQVMLIENTSCGTDTIIQTITVSNSAVYDVSISVIGGNSFCPNEILTFSNQNPANTYFWDFGDNSYSVASQPQHQYSATGDYRVILRATNMCGNSNSDTVFIHIQNNSTIWTNINVWPNNACPGEQFNFNAWTVGQFNWSFGDGTNSTLTSPTHSYADTGHYQIQLIVTNACGNIDTVYTSVTVEYHQTNPPMASIEFSNFDNWNNNQQIDTLEFCPNTNVDFRNNSWNTSSNTQYFWSFGDDSTSTLMNPSHTFVTSGTHVVMLIVSDICGASDTAYKWIIVNPGINPYSNLQSLPNSICTGETVYFFDDKNKEFDNQYTYSIWFGDGTSILNFTENTDTIIDVLASHQYNAPGTFNYIFTVTNSCGNTDSLTGTVIVNSDSNPDPFYYIENSTYNNNFGNIPDWSMPSGSNNHQFYIPIHFNQWVSGMNNTYLVAFWYGHADTSNLGQPDGLMVVQGQGIAHAYIPVNNDSITIFGAWFCGGQPENSEPDAYGFLGVFPLTINEITHIAEPGIQIAGWDGTCDSTQMQNPNAACIGDNVNFMIVGGMSYEWHFGDGTTSTIQNPTHSYNQIGIFNAFCLVTNGCGSIDTIRTDVTIDNHNLPTANMNIDQGGWSCANTPIQFWYQNNNNNSENYSFHWDFDDGTTSDLTNPSHEFSHGGQYTVTLTVSNGCGSSSTTRVVNINEPQVNTIVSNGCGNSNSGFVELNVINSWNTVYTWSNGANTNIISNLSPGTYHVTVTDGSGCNSQKTFIIEQVASVQISEAVSNISCNGLNNGSINITMTGGNAPYIFSWSNLQNIEDLSNLSSGSYSLTATDANGCFDIVDNMIITEPLLLSVNLTSTDLTCHGIPSGSIISSVTGGISPYTFIWSNGAATSSVSDLQAGLYLVTVSDVNNCQEIVTQNILQPSQINITLDFTTTPTCNAFDGAINISVNGGTPPYTYHWNDAVNQTVEDPIGLPAGAFIVTVTDNISCEVQASYALNNLNAPVINLNITNDSCHNAANGEVVAQVTGGTPTYTYVWSNSATSNTISGVGAGTYILTVTDQANCIATAIAQVTEPDSIQIHFTIQNILCFNGSNGSVNTVVSGGTLPYSFLWSNNAIVSGINSLVAGVYNISVTDNLGCIANGSAVVTQPILLQANLQIVSNVLCNGEHQGQASISASGGIAPYSFIWSDLSVNNTISNLFAGNVSVTITDNNSCHLIKSGVITQPNALHTVITSQDITCFGFSNGSASVTVTGGTSPYQYNWSNQYNNYIIDYLSDNKYYLTVTDNNNCTITDSVVIHEPSVILLNITTNNAICFGAANGTASVSASGGTGSYSYSWSNGHSGQNNSGLHAGIHGVTVTDLKNCIATAIANITEPDLIQVNFTVQNVFCYNGTNGSANAAVSGGTQPYTFLWSNNAVLSGISNIGAGMYNISVTDYLGCTANGSAVVTQPLLLQADLQIVSNVHCKGEHQGQASISASGGIFPYSFLWSDLSVNNTISNLYAGPVSVTVTDANSCTTVKTANITQPAELLATNVVTDASSNTASDGAINLSVTGGTLPYLYHWNNNALTQDLNNIATGNYFYSVTDAKGCHTTDTIFVGFADLINTISETSVLKIYPNPTNDKIFFSNAENTKIEIFNLIGSKLAEIEPGLNLSVIDMSSFANGNYYIRISKDNYSVVKKIVLRN